jgi:hypothetical protein
MIFYTLAVVLLTYLYQNWRKRRLLSLEEIRHLSHNSGEHESELRIRVIHDTWLDWDSTHPLHRPALEPLESTYTPSPFPEWVNVDTPGTPDTPNTPSEETVHPVDSRNTQLDLLIDTMTNFAWTLEPLVYNIMSHHHQQGPLHSHRHLYRSSGTHTRLKL